MLLYKKKKIMKSILTFLILSYWIAFILDYLPSVAFNIYQDNWPVLTYDNKSILLLVYDSIIHDWISSIASLPASIL